LFAVTGLTDATVKWATQQPGRDIFTPAGARGLSAQRRTPGIVGAMPAGPARRRDWAPELALLALAILARLLLVARFDPHWGYDAESHLRNIEWYRDHAGLPAIGANRTAYHPPLFYATAGALLRLGGHGQAPLVPETPQPDTAAALSLLHALPVGAAVLRLCLYALLLRLALPGRGRPVRALALALVGLLPVGIHADVMVSNESFASLFAAGSLLFLYLLASGRGRPLWSAAGLGVSLGLALLSKFSALALLAAAAATGAGHLAWRAKGLRHLWALLWPWAVALALALSISGWYYARNVTTHGRLTPTPFEAPGWDRDQLLAADGAAKPYLQRRPLSYFLGWDAQIFRHPFFPTAARPGASHFFPVLVASSFVDYYNYGFARDPEAGKLPDDVAVNGWGLRPVAVVAARVANAGGLVIAATTALALLALAVVLWRRREAGELPLVLVPLATLAGQLHFAIQYPVDSEGVVKGAYMQQAALPLSIVFAAAVVWLWRRRWGRELAGACTATLLCLAAYVVVCLGVSWGWRALIFFI
jgi:hypothetical protein